MAEQQTEDISNVSGVGTGLPDHSGDTVIRGVGPGGTTVQVAVDDGGTLQTKTQLETLGLLEGGTIDVLRDVRGGSLTQMERVRTVGQLEDVQGGSLTQIERVRTIGQLEDVQGGSLTTIHQLVSGSISQIERVRRVGAVEDLQTGSLSQVERVRTVGQLEDVQGGSLTQIERVRTVGQLEDVQGGSLTQIERVRRVGAVEDHQGGSLTTVHEIQRPRTDRAATLAQNFDAVAASTSIPGTFDVSQFDGFTVAFNTIGHHGGTITVDHELRMAPGGQWFTDGSDPGITGDHVTTLGHKGFQYRPNISNTFGDGATVDAVARGN